MTLFEQWTLVNYIANKDYQGNIIEPDTFAELVKVVNLDLFKVKMGLPEDYQLGAPLSRQYIDATQILTDETRFLKKTIDKSRGIGEPITYPNDYYTFNSMRYDYTAVIDQVNTTVPKTVEILTEDEYSDRAGNYIKRPTTENPVCVIREDGIWIYPETIQLVELAYITYPVEPVFAYNQEAGYITEDAAGSTQYGWPEILHMDLTRMILGYVGINIREQQLQQYAEAHKAAGV